MGHNRRRHAGHARAVATRIGAVLAFAALLAGCGNGGGEWHEVSALPPPAGGASLDYSGLGAAASPSTGLSPSPSASSPAAPALGPAEPVEQPPAAKPKPKPKPKPPAPPPFPKSADAYAREFMKAAISKNKARATELWTDNPSLSFQSVDSLFADDVAMTLLGGADADVDLIRLRSCETLAGAPETRACTYDLPAADPVLLHVLAGKLGKPHAVILLHPATMS